MLILVDSKQLKTFYFNVYTCVQKLGAEQVFTYDAMQVSEMPSTKCIIMGLVQKEKKFLDHECTKLNNIYIIIYIG